MGRGVQVFVICEDKQHQAFVRAFLRRCKFNIRLLAFVMNPPGAGDAKQFVQARFPIEVSSLRRYSGQGRILIVMADADELSSAKRLQMLDRALEEAGMEPVVDSEPIFCFAPRWNIETWLAYLRGDVVEENLSDYPRLRFESDAVPLANRLVEMCDNRKLEPTPPSSLLAACQTYELMRQYLAKE